MNILDQMPTDTVSVKNREDISPCLQGPKIAALVSTSHIIWIKRAETKHTPRYECYMVLVTTMCIGGNLGWQNCVFKPVTRTRITRGHD